MTTDKQDLTALVQSKNVIITKSGLTNVPIIEFHYTWMIKNYEHWYPDEDDVDFLSSPPFITNHETELKWYLELFPNGYDEDCKDYLSIRPYLATEEHSLKQLIIELSLLNANQEELAVKRVVFDVKMFGDYEHVREFVRRDFVFDKSNKLLNNGVLTVLCKIFFIEDVEQHSDPIIKHGIQTSETQRRLKLFDEYEQLLFNEKFSDFRLLVKNEEFPVHRNILAAKSQVFMAMLEHDTKEKKEGQVEIVDIEPDVVREMLRFIYVGKVNGIEKLARGLLAAAEKYDLKELKLTCEEVFIGKLSLDTIGEVFKIVDEYNTDQLKVAAMEFTAKNSKVLSVSEKFKNVTKILSSALLAEILNVFMK